MSSAEGNICYWPVTEDGEVGEVMFDRVPGKVKISAKLLLIRTIKALQRQYSMRACSHQQQLSCIPHLQHNLPFLAQGSG